MESKIKMKKCFRCNKECHGYMCMKCTMENKKSGYVSRVYVNRRFRNETRNKLEGLQSNT